MKFRLVHLDAPTRFYLQGIWKTRGPLHNGLLLRRREGRPSNWGIWCLLGALFAGVVAGFLCFPLPPTAVRLICQIGLLALTCWLLLVGCRSVVRYFRCRNDPNSLFYVDALWVWDVHGGRVQVTPLEKAEHVECTHRRDRAGYRDSNLIVSLPHQDVRWVLRNHAFAEKVLQFIDSLIFLRRSEAQRQQPLYRDPQRLGAAALQLANGAEAPDLSRFLPALPIPTPGQRSLAQRLPAAALPWAAALVVGAVAWLALPPLNQSLWDNQTFAEASHKSRVDHSPTLLREYLADGRHVDHRQEAQEMIDVYYDEAIARLRSLAKKHEVDEELFGALLALLEGLKKADKPIVTIGFRAHQDAEPTTDETKQAETALSKQYVEQYPALKEVAAKSPTRTAILPYGETFSETNTKRREQVIVDLLREAFQNVLQADLLSLNPAEAGQKPTLEVSYRTRPSGSLYTMTTRGPEKKLEGLLRGYEFEWTITIRPPDGRKAHVCHLTSTPQAEFTYLTVADDPPWAWYAILLYSGFYDMSNQLIGAFGLEPRIVPESYTFAQVTGKPPDTTSTKPPRKR